MFTDTVAIQPSGDGSGGAFGIGPWLSVAGFISPAMGFEEGTVVTPLKVRFMALLSLPFPLYSEHVGPHEGTQFDLKQATGFEALSVVPMNTLLLIKEKELKAQRLQDAQRCFAAHSEGIDYTSAHLSPTKLAPLAR